MINKLIEYMVNSRGQIEVEVANAVVVEITSYKGKPISKLTSTEIETIRDTLEERILGEYSSYSLNGDYITSEYFFEKCLVFESKEEKESLIKDTEEYIKSILPVDVIITPIIDVD